jgi:hypothetical protein
MTAARAIDANAEAPRSFVWRSEVSLLDPGYDLLVQIARGVMGFAALNPTLATFARRCHRGTVAMGAIIARGCWSDFSIL